MLHIGHWVVVLASTHGLNAGAEACDGQDNDITNFLGRLHAGKVFPCNVTLACAHIEVVGVVEVVEDGIGPDSGPGKLDDAFVVFAELARVLAVKCLLGDVCNNINKHGMARLRLNSPLAELDAAGVPLGPVRAIWISLDADDHSVGVRGYVRGYPIRRRLQCRSVDIRVDAATGKEDKVAEKIGFQHRDRESVVGFNDLRNRRI